ncbi:tetratricopeptide repeat protein [Mesotoga sp. UBA6090]|nr:tetratricopeptide repeat protein [Mesotoga sp. UBA6090]
MQKDQRTLQICLSEIERCQNLSPKPNFIILLGDRYGWEPLPYSIPSTELDSLLPLMDESERSKISEWYRRDDNAIPSEYILQPRKDEYESYALWEEKERELREILRKAVDRSTLDEKEREKYFLSATHREIIHGALGIPEGKISPQEHVVACFRKGEKDERLQRLEEELKDRLSKERTREYESLDNEKDEEEFSQFIYERLEETISLQLKDVQEIDELEEERNRHREYREELLEDFCGREKILEDISEYIEGEDNRIFALTGESGSGKSSVMAKAIEHAEREKNVVIYRFSGFTANSGNEYTLLKQLCEEITGKYDTTVNKVAGIEEGERPPVMEGSGERRNLDPNKLDDLIEVFRRCLVLSTEDKRLILFIDALDQIDGNLTWLPSLLPRYTRLVVSTTLDKEIELPHRLERLKEREGEEILDRWLARAKRRLQSEQREAIMNGLKSNGTPIYLRLLFDMAKNWHSYTGIPRLGEKTEEILKEFCDRLEREHTPERVKTIIGYMVCGRYAGLKEEELIDLLSFDEEYYESFLKGSQHTDELMERRKIPVVIWSRFYLDLEDHLREKEVEGVRILTFFHRQIDEYMKERYGTNRNRNHGILADYGLKRFESEGKNSKEAFLSSSIMPYVGFHLYEAEREKELLHLLPEEEETEEQGNKKDILYNSIGWVMENYGFEEEKRLKALLEEISTIDRKVLAFVMSSIGVKQKNRGRSLWCLFIHEKSIPILERLVRMDPTNLELLRDLGISLNNAGRNCKGLVAVKKTLGYYMRALEIRKRLVKKIPDRTEWQNDLSLSLSDIGNIYKDLGQSKKTLEYYVRSLEISKNLAMKQPDRTEWQWDLGVSLNNVGSVYEELGKSEKALECYLHFMKIMESLVEKDTSRTCWRRDLGTSANNVGRIYEKSGKNDESLGYYTRFMEIMEQLIRNDPGRLDWQRDLGVSLNNIGRIYEDFGEAEKALGYYVRSNEILEAVIEKDPSRMDRWRDLGVSLNNSGMMYEFLGEGERALECYTRFIEIMEDLIWKDPDRIDWQYDLSVGLSNAGNICRSQNENDKALVYFTRSTEIRENLVKKDPDRTDWQRDLGISLNNVGMIHETFEEYDKALLHYKRFMEIMEALVKRDPERTDWQRDLGVSLNNIGSQYENLGELEKASDHYKRVLDIRRTLVDKEPRVVDRHVGLAFALLDIARITQSDAQKRELEMEARSITKSLVDDGMKHRELNVLRSIFSL